MTAGPSRSSRRPLRAALLFGVSAAAAAAISSALFAGTRGGRAATTAARAEIRAVSPVESASFAILRGPPGDPRRGPAGERAGSGPFGANPALARSLVEPRSSLSSRAVSVVPANRAICLRVPLGPGAERWWCQTLALARRGKLVIALRPAGRLRASKQLLIGLVPDGVTRVTIIAAEGVRRSVTVRHNAYQAQVYAPRTIAIDLPGSGVQRYPAP